MALSYPAPPQEQPALPSLCSDRRTSGTRLDSQSDQPPHPAFGHGSPGHDEGAFRCTEARSPNGADCPPPAMTGPFLRLSPGPWQTRNTSPAGRSVSSSLPTMASRSDGPFPVRCRPVPYQNTAARSLPGRKPAPTAPPARFPAQPAALQIPAFAAAATISIACVAKPHVVTAAHCPRCQPAGSNHAALSP